MRRLKYEDTNVLDRSIINDHISIISIDDDVVTNKDLSIGCGIKIDAPYSPCLAAESIEAIFKNLSGFLNSLPSNYDLQLIWTQNSRTKELINSLQESKLSAGLIGKVQNEQQNNIIGLFNEGELRWINIYFLIIRKPLPEDLISSTKLSIKNFTKELCKYFIGINSTNTYKYNKRKSAIAEMLLIQEQLYIIFNKLGYYPNKLKSRDINIILYQRWNPRQYNTGNLPRDINFNCIPISENILQSTFFWDPTGKKLPRGVAELDGWYHTILTLQEPPEEASGFIFDNLMLIDDIKRCEIIINSERGNKIERIKRLKNILAQRLSHNDTFADPSQRIATQQIELELENLGADSESTWRAATYIHVWAESVEEVKLETNKIQTLARSRDIILIQEIEALWPYWKAIQPFWTQDKDRYRLLDYSSNQLLRLLPLFGQPTNLSLKKNIGVLYQTASRSIFNWVIPDESLFTNPHYLIIGGTGSGKSALAVENLIAFQRKDAQVVIIDLGGSFSSFCNSCNGIYIDYNIKSKSNRINPLWLPSGIKLDAEILRTNTLWVESLLSDQGKRISHDDLVSIEEALKKAYLKDLNEPVYLHTLKGILQSDSTTQHLARYLSPWCEDGALANLFDGPTVVDLSASIVVFDLKRVMHDQRDTELTRIIFNSIVNTVVGLSLTHTKKSKYLVYDEAGILLKNESTANFMEYCFRTLRKTGVSVSAISQGIEDFTTSTDSRNGFIGAVDNIFILRQENADKIRLIGNEKNLSVRELNVIESLNTIAGKYAEFALIQQTPFGMRMLHLLSASTPLKYAFTANSPEDRRMIYEYQQSGLNRNDALLKFSREYPFGKLSSRKEDSNENI
jgi:hypothetical protein